MPPADNSSSPPGPAIKHRPNVLFYLLGLPLIIVGIGLIVTGGIGIFEWFTGGDGLSDDGRRFLGQNVILVFWGAIVLTIGRYLWRGARRRGWKDRVGRVLIIVGYLLLGIGLSLGVSAIAGAPAFAGEDQARADVIGAAISLAMFAVPGAIVAGIGMAMAKEEELLEASTNVQM